LSFFTKGVKLAAIKADVKTLFDAFFPVAVFIQPYRSFGGDDDRFFPFHRTFIFAVAAPAATVWDYFGNAVGYTGSLNQDDGIEGTDLITDEAGLFVLPGDTKPLVDMGCAGSCPEFFIHGQGKNCRRGADLAAAIAIGAAGTGNRGQKRRKQGQPVMIEAARLQGVGGAGGHAGAATDAALKKIGLRTGTGGAK